MIFNNISKEYIRVRRELFRPPSAPIDMDPRPLANGGSRVKRKRFTDFTLPVPIKINSPDRKIEDLKEELSDWLIHAEAKKLVFKDTPDLYYLAHYQGMELDQHPHRATGIMYFYIPEGCRHGLDRPLNLTSAFQTFAISGQQKTPWTSKTTFSTASQSFTLENNKGGKIVLKFNFIAGDILEIDYEKRKVTLNGNALQVAIQLQTVWFELEPGQIQLRASRPTTLSYTERYY